MSNLMNRDLPLLVIALKHSITVNVFLHWFTLLMLDTSEMTFSRYFLLLVSKKYLEKVNSDVSSISKVNQWRNTSTVIEWFKAIPNKGRSRFIKFDIVEFYPSISEKLLDKSINYAKQLTTFDDKMISFIKQARKSLLFDINDTWIKKGGTMFDVTMGSFDGAEICELVGLYLLDKLSIILEKESIGLYRDDGLAVINNANGPKLDKLRKDIISLFKGEGLSITIDINLIETEFLDVTFNLATNRFFPYRKPNDKPLYINVNSNHPDSITKQLPKMVNRRVHDLSCNQEEFDKAKETYQLALGESGYDPVMTYDTNQTKVNRRNRKRKVIWFIPPFSQNVKINIERQFINLIKKYFPKHHKFHKIFNSNTLKLSYCCTTNMANIIKQHNSSILNNATKIQEPTCNCRTKANCPLNGNCQVKCIVYKAAVITESESLVYYGASEGDFKMRYNNHTKSFRHRKYENDTELSKCLWKLKDEDTEFNLSWSIATHASPYKCGTRRCDLCLAEKATIIRAEPKGLLNKRTELISKCRHRNKFILNNLK